VHPQRRQTGKPLAADDGDRQQDGCAREQAAEAELHGTQTLEGELDPQKTRTPQQREAAEADEAFGAHGRTSAAGVSTRL
jgi:hypothetical protein